MQTKKQLRADLELANAIIDRLTLENEQLRRENDDLGTQRRLNAKLHTMRHIKLEMDDHS